MSEPLATNAASSSVEVERKVLKSLMRRSDRAALVHVALWVAMLALTGSGVYASLGTLWVIPAVIAHGTVLTVPSYALSHECAHGTAFRSRWLNESVLWITSLLYCEEPYHRRYAHARHHTYTWINGKDAQMPFETPMTLKGWLLEISGVALMIYETKIFVRNALGLFDPFALEYTPASELPKLKWGARACLAVYLGGGGLAWNFGAAWPLWFLLLPRLADGPVMLLFTLIQHVEMTEDQLDIRKSTRSFRTGWLGRFLYGNMNHHIEHHLYPMVPFYNLPALNVALKDQLPEPDPGFFRTNLEVLATVIGRALGRLPARNRGRQIDRGPAGQAAE